ncbi:polyamine ABC transporter substrate-binding protein [Thermofilum pendens]|uniref:Extracellular solute-binding protein, family 1 n=1 Tax=Thermofilum pendens (strain DSM 2475 / Hrk 5) TaxID=368408 RepID=A1RYN1_THEPD|nr:spermidine/putrescine ABC transporter substrate-binding protein [Thermofilum pendens]ABL78311.1 extracellular solute-binding protein, family 1 [Thermofilum pendens Hrk 5]
MKLTRRQFLASLGAAAALASIGAYYWIFPKREERVLRVYNYSAYINPDIIKDFESKYGVKVIYDEYESAEEAYAKLQLGGGGYDVIVLTDQYVPQAVKKGLVAQLDKTRIPNLGNVDRVFFENNFDPGLRYAVPYAWGTTGIGVNRDYVAEGEIEGYEQLFDTKVFLPRHKGKVSMLEEFLEVVNAAKLYLGIPLNDWSEESKQRIIELLREQRDFLAGYYGASVYIPALAKGDLHAAHAWSGDVVQAQSENKSVEYVLPKEGAFVWIDFMVIPVNARSPDLAYEWINFLLDPAVAAKNSSYTYYPSPVKRELLEGLIGKDVLENPAVYPPSGTKLVQTYPLDESALKVVEEISTAVKRV